MENKEDGKCSMSLHCCCNICKCVKIVALLAIGGGLGFWAGKCQSSKGNAMCCSGHGDKAAMHGEKTPGAQAHKK